MKKLSDQECRGGDNKEKLTFNTLDQNMINFKKLVWPRFELNVFE
jgi:hypothetical protein